MPKKTEITDIARRLREEMESFDVGSSGVAYGVRAGRKNESIHDEAADAIDALCAEHALLREVLQRLLAKHDREIASGVPIMGKDWNEARACVESLTA